MMRAIDNSHLPPLLQEILEPINIEQRHLALLSSLVILPVFFDRAGFRTDKGFSHLNTGVLILMPPASGKGIVANLVRITSPLTDTIRTQNRAKVNLYKGRVFAKGRRNLVIGGDITAAKLMEQISENKQLPLLLADTEVDSWINSRKGEHGRQLSAILRKALEQEPVTMERRSDPEPLSADKPCLSLLFCGTSEQFHGLLRANDDGLHSRLIFFLAEGADEWIPTLPGKEGVTLEDRYTDIGRRLMTLHEAYKSVEIEITFTMDQWSERNKLGESWLESFRELGPNALSIPKRAANQLMKLAGALTLIRQCETLPTGNKVEWECHEADFSTARQFIGFSLTCSREVFEQVSLANVDPNRKRLSEWVNKLGPSFTTAQAIEAGANMGISKATVNRRLSGLVEEGSLAKTAHGSYSKQVIENQG